MNAFPRIALSLTLLAALPAVAAAERPQRIFSVDALALPVEPAVLPPLQQSTARGAAPADAKIAGQLWERLGGEAKVRVIVLLDAERVRKIAADATGADRVAATAALAQAFVARAETRGFTASGALAHLPVVFGTIAGDDLLRLAQLPEVAAVQEDRVLRQHRTQGGALMRADQLRTLHGADGTGIGVAVIDSGTDAEHSELAGRVVAEADFTGTTGDGTVDETGHGTSVGGIVAGNAGGMAPAANLWALKVLDDEGSGLTSWMLAALDAAYANRNSFGGLHVVNLSLGDSESHNTSCDALYPADAAAVNALVGAGITVVAAAGNEGYASGISGPGCLSNVLGIGAVYDANIGPAVFSDCQDLTTAADQVTCYSNSGAPLDLLAPSHCARTPVPGGGYENCFGGTSAASPYVAGVVAQLLSVDDTLTPAQIADALTASGKSVADPFTGLVRPRVDALAAYAMLSPENECVPSATTGCLLGGRFEVKVSWLTKSAAGVGSVMEFAGERAASDESMFLWFFSPTNFEMGVKMLDACAPPFNSFWVFIGGLTNQGYTVTIEDLETGRTKTYSNALGKLAKTVADTAAFPCS